MRSTDKPTIFFATRPIAPPWNEGSKNMVYEIAKRLDSFQTTVLTYKNQNDFLAKPNATLLRIYPPSNSLAISLKEKLSFLSALIRSRSEIYHFYFTPEFFSSFIIRLIKKFKKGTFLQTIPTPLKNPGKAHGYIFGDEIVVQSKHALAALTAKKIKNASCVYPGVDTERFQPGLSTAGLRERFKIKPREKIILYPGSYYLGCNGDITALILKIAQNCDDAKIIVACRTTHPREDKLKQAMLDVLAQNNASDKALFAQAVENMPELISSADIVVFPPRAMTKKSDIPIVLLESLAMEKPIVITDIPPLNEIMVADIGETVPAGNPGALYNAVKKLLADDNSRREKGARGRQAVLKHFTIDKSVKQYEAIYRKISTAIR